MRFREFFENVEQNPLIQEYNSRYPKVGNRIGGLTIDTNVNNTGSISASFNNYYILHDIREVPISDFGGIKSFFYAANDWELSEKLSERIKQSKRISTLIVAVDKEGPYILEGGHRFVALYKLGIKSFPALVVIDLDN